MENLYSLQAFREQMIRLEADLSRRTADGGEERDLRDLRWRIQKLRTKIEAEAERKKP